MTIPIFDIDLSPLLVGVVPELGHEDMTTTGD
jgi:hypothetical protein